MWKCFSQGTDHKVILHSYSQKNLKTKEIHLACLNPLPNMLSAHVQTMELPPVSWRSQEVTPGLVMVVESRKMPPSQMRWWWSPGSHSDPDHGGIWGAVPGAQQLLDTAATTAGPRGSCGGLEDPWAWQWGMVAWSHNQASGGNRNPHEYHRAPLVISKPKTLSMVLHWFLALP